MADSCTKLHKLFLNYLNKSVKVLNLALEEIKAKIYFPLTAYALLAPDKEAHQQTGQSSDYDLRDTNKNPTLFTVIQTTIRVKKLAFAASTYRCKYFVQLHSLLFFNFRT